TSVACAIGVSNSDFYRHLHKGHERRFWGLRRDGARITAIYDPRGGWLLKCSMRRYRDLGGQAVPPRKCLRAAAKPSSPRIARILCVKGAAPSRRRRRHELPCVAPPAKVAAMAPGAGPAAGG
ncbi:MAG: hypothetical protein ACK5MB_04840, partial [Phycisphaerales bacterium]